jgi:hypothetical protein
LKKEDKMDKCPKCGSERQDVCSPTKYFVCGSQESSPKVFYQSAECKVRVELIHYKGSLDAATLRVDELEALFQKLLDADLSLQSDLAAARAEIERMREALGAYGDVSNWEEDVFARRCWLEPGSKTPRSYAGWLLAQHTLAQSAPSEVKPKRADGYDFLSQALNEGDGSYKP